MQRCHTPIRDGQQPHAEGRMVFNVKRPVHFDIQPIHGVSRRFVDLEIDSSFVVQDLLCNSIKDHVICFTERQLVT